MSQPLRRYTRHTEAAADLQLIQAIIREVGEPINHATLGNHVDHTDHDRLRGIPAIGRNVTGAIPHTRPEDCLR